MGDIYIAAHLRRCLRHSVFGHVLQYTPSTSVLDALHLHHAIKSPPLRYPSPLHIAFIEVKNELVKMKDVFPMKVITHTIMHQENLAGRYSYSIIYPANFAGGQIESKMYPANFAGGRSRLDLLLPSFLPSREEKKKQDRIFCPLRGHAVGRMQYAPTSYRQETLFPINSRKERIETKIQDQKNRPLGCRGISNTPLEHPRKEEKKMQDRIFYPLRGHLVGRMLLRPTTCRQETLFPINSLEERIETKMQDQKNCPLGCRGVLNTPPIHLERDEQKMQDRIFCPLRGHSVGRMQYAPTTCRQETLFPINSLEERTETKMQDRIFCPLRGHAVGRMQYAPTSYRQEMLFPINSREERTETKMQKQKNHPLGSRGILHTPHTDRVRIGTKMQNRIFCPLRGHAVGRMRYVPTTCRQETLFPINSLEERTETKMQERRKQSIDSGAEWHTPFMRQGERDAVWRDTFLEQRARVAIWRDRRLEKKYSHARLQLSTFGENSKPYKSSLVALSEQLRDIFAA